MKDHSPILKPAGRKHDPQYLSLVHQLPCDAARYVTNAGPCSGGIEADHAGERPVGRKADDDTCIPLCSFHHRCRTDFSGPFKTWRSWEMRAYLDAAIERTRMRVARLKEAA